MNSLLERLVQNEIEDRKVNDRLFFALKTEHLKLVQLLREVYNYRTREFELNDIELARAGFIPDDFHG